MADPNPGINKIERRIVYLSEIEQKSLSVLKIIIFLLAIYFMIGVTFWIFEKEDGISVQPFEMVGFGANLNGKALASLLSFDLQRIKDTYEPIPEMPIAPNNNSRNRVPRPLGEFYIPPLASKNAPLEYRISSMGTVGTEGTSFSPGNIFLSMKEFFGNRLSTVSCSLQKYNHTMIIVAVLDDHHTKKTDTMAFRVERIINNTNASIEDEIPLMIDDLAFQISLELSKRWVNSKESYLYPQTWLSFKYLTQGRDAYNSYMITRDTIALNKLEELALLAKSIEPNYGGSFELLSSLGFAYVDLGKFDEAANAFQNITEFKPFESAMGMGLVYGNKGYYKEALYSFDLATKLNSKYSPAWNNKGVILYRMGSFNDSIKAYDEAIRLDPKYVAAWNNKGDALNNQGRYNEAIRAYDMAIQLDKNYSIAWYGKGITLADMGKPDEALLAYNKSIELNPKQMEVWYNKGLVLYYQYKYEEALQAYDKSLELNPKLIDAWYNRGIVLFEMRRYVDSVESYDKAIHLNPSHVNAWNGKSIVFYTQRKYESAIEACDKALEVDPKQTTAWNNKGLALFELKKYNESVLAFDMAINIDNGPISAWRGKFYAQKLLGQTDEANSTLSRAKALGINITKIYP